MVWFAVTKIVVEFRGRVHGIATDINDVVARFVYNGLAIRIKNIVVIEVPEEFVFLRRVGAAHVMLTGPIGKTNPVFWVRGVRRTCDQVSRLTHQVVT